MELSAKDLAIKYHSLEDELWVENGSNSISMVSGEYEFNRQKFQDQHQLFDHILTSGISDVLIVCDNNVEPSLIADLIASCKAANVSRIAIKSTYAYGK